MLNLSRKPKQKRSPIPQPSLPQPGDSLQRETYSRFQDSALWWLIAAMFTAIAATEWLRYWFPFPRTPWVYSVCCLLAAIFCARRAWTIRHTIDPLLLGLSGERTVGQVLETLRSRGYRVIHDLEQDGYNIDHVLVGPAGIFAVETKTYSKPNDRNAQIVYDGQRILVDGHQPDRDPIAQASANARRIRQILKEQTGQDVFVKPVILYPGWFIKCTVRNPAVYVANENWFLKSFDREHSRRTLDDTQIELLTAGLQRAARSLR